jgi:hypothetical protein
MYGAFDIRSLISMIASLNSKDKNHGLGPNVANDKENSLG